MIDRNITRWAICFLPTHGNPLSLHCGLAILIVPAFLPFRNPIISFAAVRRKYYYIGVGTAYAIIAESTIARLICLFFSQFGANWKHQAKPGRSKSDLSNGVHFFLFRYFHQRVLHQTLSKLECFHTFGQHDLTSVAAVFLFAELCQCRRITPSSAVFAVANVQRTFK